jgi:hypothetical protein
VRLGLIGPARGDLDAFAKAATVLFDEGHVTRAIYLGADDVLETAITLWAESLVGPDTTDAGLWDRAFPLIEEGTPAAIESFTRAERARSRLRCIEGLPSRELRSIEMLGDRLAVLAHDTADLDEEDIFAAALLIYGKSEGPVAKRIGPRWFISPGPLGPAGGGSAVIEDSSDDVVVTFWDVDGHAARPLRLGSARSAVVNVVSRST